MLRVWHSGLIDLLLYWVGPKTALFSKVCLTPDEDVNIYGMPFCSS